MRASDENAMRLRSTVHSVIPFFDLFIIQEKTIILPDVFLKMLVSGVEGEEDRGLGALKLWVCARSQKKLFEKKSLRHHAPVLEVGLRW